MAGWLGVGPGGGAYRVPPDDDVPGVSVWYCALGPPYSAASSPSDPRRRSYTKLVPLAIPSAGSARDDDGALGGGKDAFAPSSFPTSAPILPPPPPASALSMYQVAHRYGMPGLAALALEHMMATLTPAGSFALLRASATWEELHQLVEVRRTFFVSASGG